MIRIFFLATFTSLFLHLKANDGVFYAAGNTLIPIKETTIQMRKEILNLERRGEWMQVDIYFEFFNPGEEKELIVGFVTPPAEGDAGDAEMAHPQVKDFMIMNGDRLLTFKIMRMEQTGFKVDSKLANGYDFVYYFTIRFKKGLNVIRHSYLYRGGSSVEVKNDFDYRLTTGTGWAGGNIGDFELNINMGDDSYFSVPDAFGIQPANWTIAGIGRVSPKINFNPYADENGGANLRMVFMRKGKLQLRVKNFKPLKDLSVNIFQLHNEISLWSNGNVKNEFSGLPEIVWADDKAELIKNLSDQELRLYRNLNYARMGYDFMDINLKKIFQKFNWYLPDPAIKPEHLVEYYIDNNLLKLISEEEKRRKLVPDGQQ
ncbi:MAG TPA: YARHG domain-containing protein [Chitinophagaceae bacterium]|nr:YARHG domain-containing protein [Chitinophagaceae bacterium]